jgi:hypothetical protein
MSFNSLNELCTAPTMDAIVDFIRALEKRIFSRLLL